MARIPKAFEDQVLANALTIALAVLREDKQTKLEAMKLFPQALLSKPKRKKDKDSAEAKETDQSSGATPTPALGSAAVRELLVEEDLPASEESDAGTREEKSLGS